MTQSLQGARGGQTILEPANIGSQQRSGFGQQDPFDERRQAWSQAPEDSLLHQQDQRGVTSLQNAANASSNAARAVSPTGSQQISGFGADAKRGGPVEFNHAISYVNKIKVCRFRLSKFVVAYLILHHASTSCRPRLHLVSCQFPTSTEYIVLARP